MTAAVASPVTRQCRSCKSIKPIESFGFLRKRDRQPIRVHVCQSCSIKKLQDWKARQRAANPEADIARTSARRLRAIGLTVDDYNRILESQAGVCAICGHSERLRTKWGSVSNLLVVDHDHATHKVRGLLCHNCNKALGLLGDSADVLVAAAAYLRGQT